MDASRPGTLLTDGEVFIAHFNRTSILNLFFEYPSEAVQGSCFYILSGNEGLPVEYNLPTEGTG